MHYLTNYYKNLSEQLQSKINHLQNLIETNKQRLDPVGKEDKDINNDGKVNSTDDYLRNRREAIGDALNRHEHKKGYKETKRNAERKPTDDELAREHELEMDRAMHRDYEN
jgi:hypothetical protein